MRAGQKKNRQNKLGIPKEVHRYKRQRHHKPEASCDE